MKTAYKLKIKHWIMKDGKKGELVLDIEKTVCPYCEKSNIYPIKSKGLIYCRSCGKESRK